MLNAAKCQTSSQQQQGQFGLMPKYMFHTMGADCVKGTKDIRKTPKLGAEVDLHARAARVHYSSLTHHHYFLQIETICNTCSIHYTLKIFSAQLVSESIFVL